MSTSPLRRPLFLAFPLSAQPIVARALLRFHAVDSDAVDSVLALSANRPSPVCRIFLLWSFFNLRRSLVVFFFSSFSDRLPLVSWPRRQVHRRSVCGVQVPVSRTVGVQQRKAQPPSRSIFGLFLPALSL